MIFDEDLFNKGIYLVEHILEKERVKTIDYFHNIGLSSENIMEIWKISDAVLKSGKY